MSQAFLWKHWYTSTFYPCSWVKKYSETDVAHLRNLSRSVNAKMENVGKVQKLRLLFVLPGDSFGVLLLQPLRPKISLLQLKLVLLLKERNHLCPGTVYTNNTCVLCNELNQITGHKYTTWLLPFCQLLETKIVVMGKKFCKCI